MEAIVISSAPPPSPVIRTQGETLLDHVRELHEAFAKNIEMLTVLTSGLKTMQQKQQELEQRLLVLEQEQLRTRPIGPPPDKYEPSELTPEQTDELRKIVEQIPGMAAAAEIPRE